MDYTKESNELSKANSINWKKAKEKERVRGTESVWDAEEEKLKNWALKWWGYERSSTKK